MGSLQQLVDQVSAVEDPHRRLELAQLLRAQVHRANRWGMRRRKAVAPETVGPPSRRRSLRTRENPAVGMSEKESVIKMRIALMCVGTSDPEPERHPGQDGPILSFFDYVRRLGVYAVYKPDRIYLLSTMNKPGAINPTQTRGVETARHLDERGWEVYHHPLDVLDPTDYSALLPEMKRVVHSILKEPGNEEAEVLVNVSPGTGQMEAVWFALINAGFLRATALQVKAPWDEPNEERRVRKVEFEPLFETQLIRIAHDLFKEYAFARAAEVLFQLALTTPDSQRAQRVELFSDLADAYAKMENFLYTEARASLQEIDKRFHHLWKDTNFKPLKELLDLQLEAMAKVAGGELSAAAQDLYASAKRRCQVGQYVECIWRCWSAYELVVTEKAREVIRSECRLLQNYPLPYRLHRYLEGARGTREGMSVIGLWGDLARVPKYLDRVAAEEVLMRRQAPQAQPRDFIERNEQGIEELAQLRHRTLHALHEASPPGKGECDWAVDLIHQLLRQTFGIQPAEYPLVPQKFDVVAEMIARVP